MPSVGRGRDKEANHLGDVFLVNSKYRSHLDTTNASAVIIGRSEGDRELPLSALVVDDPYRTFLHVLHVFAPGLDLPLTGVDPTAIVDPEATLGERVAVGPHVVIRPGAVLEDDVVVMAGCYIGAGTRVGTKTLLYPSVVLRERVEIGARCILQAGAVVGSDGFGFAPTGEGHVKIPQIGRVVVEDDVEIGANSSIDRATTGVTRIGRGTKIDNLVHIAHNVEIGPHSVLCAQVGISGSTKLGSWVTLAGQAGLVGHIEIGDGARVGAQGGVTKSIASGETVSGYPATNHARAQRVYASMRHLPDALRTLRSLEQRIEELEARLAAQEPPARTEAEFREPVREHAKVSGGRNE
ncbi:MAG: UDP-3-O-(3-hydroxymyristoyl)glucosamine N-acyltransferase [Candidatus Eisenbacteria bacterium]